MRNLFLVLAMLVAVNASGQWEQMPNGMGNDCLSNFFTTCGNYLFAGTTGKGVFRSSNGGASWDSVNSGLTNRWVMCLYTENDVIYAGTESSSFSRGGLYKSTNYGESWDSTSLMGKWVSYLYFSGVNKYAATYYNGIYRSTNNGVNWVQINSGLLSLSIGCITELNGDLFVGTKSNGVYKSSNYGDYWYATSLYGTYINSLAVLNNTLYAGAGSDGVWRSTDDGINWAPVNTGIGFTYVWSLVTSGTNIFAGTEQDGVFLSTNNGNFWIAKNTGFTTLPPIFYMYEYNNFLYAATYGQSVWRRLVSEIIKVQNISTEIPSAFSLGQNYPNPFNPNTVIRFEVANGFPVKTSGNDKVVLKVYDVMGREVETLVNERLKPGSYEVTFDGSGLNSGVYFYKMVVRHGGSSTDGFSETKRMVLLK
ncbi:MAG: T9SS type A sorting domain-containing protein [Candidatus Kapaibacterium sp.]